MKSIRDFGASFGSTLLITAFTTIGGVLAARLLGPAGRGALTAAILWPSTLAALGNLGLIEAVTYFTAPRYGRSREILSSGLTIAAALSVIITAAGFFLLPRLLASHGSDEIRTARWCLSLVPLNLFSLTLSAYILGTGRVAAYSVARSTVHVVTVLGMLALYVARQASVQAFAIAALAANAVSLGYWVILAKDDLFRLPLARWHSARDLLTYGIKSHIGVLASLMNLRLDQLLMSVLLAPDLLGFYVVGVAIAGVVNLPASAMLTSTFPRITAAPDPKEQTRILGQATRIALSMCIAIGLVFMIVAPYLIRLLFGAAYLPAVLATRILVGAAIPLALVSQLEAGFKALNYPELPSYGEAIGLITTGVSLALLLPRFGIAGAAIASVLGYSCTAVFLACSLRTRTGLSGRALLQPRATDWRVIVDLYRQVRMINDAPASPA